MNSDILPSTDVFIVMGGLKRIVPEGIAESGFVQFSGVNAPMFTGNGGFWDANK